MGIHFSALCREVRAALQTSHRNDLVDNRNLIFSRWSKQENKITYIMQRTWMAIYLPFGFEAVEVQ